MSGMVGIVARGGSVDAAVVRRMTASLAFRGPDRQSVWIDGAIGLGHAALVTGAEHPGDAPATIDGQVWITADARIDARGDLIASLGRLGHRALDTADDCRLILHAYREWGERCVDHLLGDFSFAIWDGGRRRLFCARDRFGVKPFYYADTPDGFIFSNTLDCVRLHPAVDDRLDELAVADFLMFGCNTDDSTTTFAQVRRLPPAHALTRDADLRVRRYWSVPADGHIRYRRPEDYVGHFLEVLETSVSDRLPASTAGIWMSGGLDSTSIAATARRVAGERGLHAHTIVYDSLIPDQERAFAGRAASSLKLRSSFFAADRYKPFDGWVGQTTPEPTDDAFFVMRTKQMEQAAASSRVLLCGEGADELFRTSYVVDLIGRTPAATLARDVLASIVLHRRRPGFGIRRWANRRFGRRTPVATFPAWIDDAFAARHALRARWDGWHRREPAADHPLRPEAHGRVVTTPWAWYFEAFDPGVTRVPVEQRYPFLDVRLVNYLLAVPPVPWCVDKHLLRVAMRGILPEMIRVRPKAPLGGDPLRAHLRQSGAELVERFDPVPELAAFVNRAAIPPVAATQKAEDTALRVRPYCLDHWLRHGRARIAKETVHANAD